jgi:hypothetical protein
LPNSLSNIKERTLILFLNFALSKAWRNSRAGPAVILYDRWYKMRINEENQS